MPSQRQGKSKPLGLSLQAFESLASQCSVTCLQKGVSHSPPLITPPALCKLWPMKPELPGALRGQCQLQAPSPEVTALSASSSVSPQTTPSSPVLSYYSPRHQPSLDNGPSHPQPASAVLQPAWRVPHPLPITQTSGSNRKVYFLAPSPSPTPPAEATAPTTACCPLRCLSTTSTRPGFRNSSSSPASTFSALGWTNRIARLLLPLAKPDTWVQAKLNFKRKFNVK